MDRIYEGEVCHFLKKPFGGFGFIRYNEGPGRDRARVYFNLEDVEPDNVGRTSFAGVIGSPVRFRIQEYLRGTEPAIKAVEVVAVFPTDEQNPDDYREVCVVENITRGHKGVFLRRESGEQLYLSRSGVADGHKDRFDRCKVGDHVWCGVQPPTDSCHPNWSAVHAEFYSPDEEVEIRRTAQEVATAEAAMAEEES